MYGKNECLLAIRPIIIKYFTRWDFMTTTDNIFYICSG